jgi:repressor LexA
MQGTRVKELRVKNHLTQEELAKAIGVSTSTIGMIEIKEKYGGINVIEKIADYFNVSLDYIVKGCDHIVKATTKNSIPILGDIACGEPIFSEEFSGEFLNVSKFTPKADFALKAKGDSMSPLVNNGEYVILKRQSTVNNGEVACVLIDNEMTLKRVYLENDTLTLVSENSRYTPIIIKENIYKTVKILGKALFFMKEAF